MEEISVVRRRTRIWPVVLLLVLIALVVLAILWMAGYFQPAELNLNVQAAPVGSVSTISPTIV